MRICRYDDDRLGLVTDGAVHDATAALNNLPVACWPYPPGDVLIANLDKLRGPIVDAAATSPAVPLAAVRLRAPVANPSKILAAPVNYAKHRDEARADAAIHHDADIKTIDYYGLFAKPVSSLAGPGDGVALRFTDRRNDHEVELAVVIGKTGSDIARAGAMAHVAGYAIGLDMTVRGTEDRSLRKGLDTFSVVGPWLVTADEVPVPDALDLEIAVNGELRQRSNTRHLIFDVAKLITYASSFYTLYPGDIIMTGTPEGVGPVGPGDVMTARIEAIGAMEVAVRAHAPAANRR